ncbi:MAG: site-2 protease family protein [Actinobacteria bacterium]|nr:site-2 protease family protein [Actinomycetota bacterium]MCA1722371.1 site-2 protease family protein [Actinomycetota bacterium]
MSDTPARRPGVRLGRVLGVPVFIAPSWFLLAALLVLALSPPLVESLGQAQAYVVSASFAVLLGLSVLLHEVGHCVVARTLGLPVRSITITFLAGFTEITKQPETPAREYSVAVAGPMVSLLLSAVGVALVPVFGTDSVAGRICENIAITNGLIAAVNLLPGLPLDGGRVLRSIVWRFVGDPEKATRAAAWAGRGIAVVVLPLVLVVLLPAIGYGSDNAGNVVFAALLSAFVYSGATAALRRSETVSRLPKVSVAALARPALRVPADVPLAEAVRRAQEAKVHALVVVDGAGRLEGVVSEAAVIATPEQRRPWVTVGTLARRVEEGLQLDPQLRGEALLEAMRRTPASEYVAQDPATGEIRVLAAKDVAKVLSA